MINIIKHPFIVGFPRSGTTLLRLMLDSHSKVAIPPETHFLEPLLQSPYPSGQEAIHHILSAERWPDFGLDASTLAIHSAKTAQEVIQAFYSAYAEKRQKEFWGDKTPRYGRILGALAQFFPSIAVVHIIRDARDVFVSRRETYSPQPLSSQRHAESWKSYIETVRSAIEHLESYTEIRYEDLVSFPQSCLSKICLAVGISYEEQMLTFFHDAHTRLEELRASLHRGIVTYDSSQRKIWHQRLCLPVDSSRVGRWRGEINASDLESIEHHCGALLRSLGYV
jgi:hypothetical protein